MPRVGDPLPIDCKLWDGNNSVFVRAYLTNDLGQSILGSPISVPNIGNGKYATSAIFMPAGTAYVSCSYEVFSDAGFTTPATQYTDATDNFPLEVPDYEILATLVEVQKALTLLATTGNPNTLVGIIDKVTDLIGYVKGDNLKAEIHIPELQGFVEPPEDED
jgi:hypothetical protein